MEKDKNIRIVVVGVCASGKSTLVAGLKEKGYCATSVVQEHSGVPGLWARAEPDFLVVLDCSLATVKRRRQVFWGEERLILQRKRLANARKNCDFYLCTDDLNRDEMVERVVQAVRERCSKRNAYDRKTEGC